MKNTPITVVQTPIRFYPHIGGVEKYVFDLSNELIKKGDVNVTVICANEPKVKDQKVGVIVKRLPYIGKLANTNITLTLPFELLKTQFDIIHTHIPTPWSADISMLVAFLKRKPFVLTYHNDILKEDKSKVIAFLYNNIFLKLLLKRASAIIITQKNYLETSKYLKQYKDKIEVVPNGIDLGTFKNEGIARDPNTLFFLSSLDKHHEYKGLGTLIEAVALIQKQNPAIKLVIGGAGELAEKYKKLSKELGVEKNVVFLCKIDEEKKNYYYQQASIFVLPSNGAQEGFGIVLLEALANKTPVITTKYAGVADEIRECNAGYVIKENDAKELAEKINSLLNNPTLAKEMGANGYALVTSKYTWDKLADRIKQIYYKFL